jgi:hypothetical protein
MQVFLLKNTGLIETGSLTDAVEATIFTAIHERITKKVERLNWELRCDILSNSEDSCKETMFAPLHWPKFTDGKRQAYYRIAETGAGNIYWLSCLLGMNQRPICFELYIDGRLGGPRVNVKERVKDFYANTPTLKELGYVCSDESVLRLPFQFDATKLAEDYPLRKPMLEFEKVFDKLMKANEHIDKMILGMKPESAKMQQESAETKPENAQK